MNKETKTTAKEQLNPTEKKKEKRLDGAKSTAVSAVASVSNY